MDECTKIELDIADIWNKIKEIGKNLIQIHRELEEVKQRNKGWKEVRGESTTSRQDKQQ